MELTILAGHETRKGPRWRPPHCRHPLRVARSRALCQPGDSHCASQESSRSSEHQCLLTVVPRCEIRAICTGVEPKGGSDWGSSQHPAWLWSPVPPGLHTPGQGTEGQTTCVLRMLFLPVSTVPSTRLTPPTHSPLSRWSSLFQIVHCTSGHLGGLLIAAPLSLGTGCWMQGGERQRTGRSGQGCGHGATARKVTWTSPPPFLGLRSASGIPGSLSTHSDLFIHSFFRSLSSKHSPRHWDSGGAGGGQSKMLWKLQVCGNKQPSLQLSPCDCKFRSPSITTASD